MAERPIFIPSPDESGFVEVRSFDFAWSPGFAVSQKKKNILALHQSAARSGYSPLLEISTKSDDDLGRQLSAFNLKVSTKDAGDVFLECVFQGGKVFERGGPYTDLYRAEPRDAKRDQRLQDSGRLVAFAFEGRRFPLEPKTAFYDWLYISAIFPRREALTALNQYAGFTDIEFNPDRSINCQARSCALFVALTTGGLIDEAMSSGTAFVQLLGAP
ncbi:MAG: hypothetical protein WBL65_01200 [Bryobacteraceae bacterium]